MKTFLLWILAFALLAGPASAALEDTIRIEALLVTKAELRRHMAADESDALRPSTRVELHAAYEKLQQPVYLVVRLLPDQPGHYTGQLEVRVDNQHRATVPVALHYTKGWVEYFVPLSGITYAIKLNSLGVMEGSPRVATKWLTLAQE
ncbi:MAG: hypothetical protein KBF26_07520 [Opitutaceae bacterium]|nr:hypothetical protein [Opitutaceae bacterium]